MINKLRAALLNALESDTNDLITKTIEAIQSVLNCDMCTLWSINYNNTDEDLGEFVSASLVERYMKKGLVYPTHNREDYVHPLKNSFIEYVLNETNENNISYYKCNIYDDNCKQHISYGSLLEMGLVYLIYIPINKNNKPIAFIKLAYKENTPIDLNEDIITVVNEAVVSVLSRHLINKKQQILSELIINYRQMNTSNLKNLFQPIIDNIFKKYFYYEGSSVFIWDSFDNRYYLLVTTGLKENPKPDSAFYKKGEGLTGTAAKENKEKIYDDLSYLEKINDPKYLHKYREETRHWNETMLTIPIVRPSNPDDVFGIMRFTNKVNKQSLIDGYPVIDYFNDTDVELIQNASHYLALNIENYLAEEERRDFISKMSHEFKTPANAIRVTAERLLRKFLQNDNRFMQSYSESYLQSIIDYSELQLMQVTTNLFLTKSNRNRVAPFTLDNHSIIDIIKDSINIVRPIAREHEVRFDNIRIDSTFPNVSLKVDKNAFKILFFNLLTNAIKYVSPYSEFKVIFSGYESPTGLIIKVSDYGIGIDRNDVEKIFLIGVRGNKARRITTEGYGIGLHVVKTIIKMYGGEICVSHCSNPTTFEILLPRKLYT